jgi:3-oxoacyl-[acyl-carrier protein] reductase
MSGPAGHGFDLRGRSVIVTGAGAGIGRVYAQRLAEARARVVLADLKPEDAEAAAQSLRDAGGEAVAVGVDIADEAATRRMAEVALSAFGRIDGLVNNAGLMSTLPRRPWHEIPVDEWDRVMDVNLRGLFLCCRAVHPAMKSQGSGAIVNISSSRVFEGTPNRLHYTTSKAGVIGFTRALARELGPEGVRVNCVTPGLTLSDTQLQSSDPAYLARTSEGRSIPRPQAPDDLVGSVLFLLSDAASFITGQTLNVDGGKAFH